MRRTPSNHKLSDLALFADCTEAELERLGSLMTMVHVDEGRVLITEGTIGLEFIIIAEGTAAVSVGTGTRGLPIATLAAGDFVGEMSLLSGQRRSANVRALSPLTVYVSNAAEFSSIADAAPRVATRIAAAAADRESANRAA